MATAAAVQHQTCDFKEEEFDPDIAALEEQRLEIITKKRSLIRDKLFDQDDHDYVNDDVEEHDYVNDDGSEQPYPGVGDDDIMVVSRNQIDCLHEALSSMSNAGTSVVRPTERSDKNDTDYINQSVLDQVANEVDEATGAAASDESKFHRVASSNGYESRGTKINKSPGHEGVASGGQNTSHMSEFEKRLFLAKHQSRPPMPDIYEIPWYHPGISRHIAECLLLSKTIKDGTYLLRDCVSDENTVTLSVRSADSVKHYKVVWDGRQFVFGLGKFPSLEDFKQHFAHKPVISSDSGVLVQLCYSYPRGVSEPAIYHEANVVATELDGDIPPPVPKQPPPSRAACKNSTSSQGTSIDLSVSVNSKEGYLTKLGFHRKNWKKRWFVLYRNELKYYNNQGDKDPLKTINLADVEKVERDGSIGKPNCLKLVTCYRTFYMYASSEVEAIEWLQILDWRLKQYRSTPDSKEGR